MKLKPAICVVAVAPLVMLIQAGKHESRKPNVIFILLDDYGYTDLGCYGSKFYETPNIDRLGRGSVSQMHMPHVQFHRPQELLL
jgi:hypothetical protein